MQEEQTTEVRETNAVDGNTNVRRQTVATSNTASGTTVLSRVIWYIVGFIIVMLALRVLLLLLGANKGNAFVDLVYGVSGVFAWPFYGIFGYEPTYGKSVFEVSSVVAMLVYALIGWGVAKLVTIGQKHPEV